ncbi:type II secretion system F family protein [Thiomicrorhabdus indica]|uniref:type II secretion system F family protein n=1 Tax=Thiomicrorhabdus indica TaxID=2267253 RepID=UPI002AA8D8AF|nr:type II secretion system F family protein [Thiomicrorhabdus indica]
MHDFGLLLAVIGLLSFSLVFILVKRLILLQEMQLQKERYKSRIGLANQFEVKHKQVQGCWWCSLGRVLGSNNKKELSKLQQQLISAGYRKESHIGAFYFIKYSSVIFALLVTALLWAVIGFSPLFIAIVPVFFLLIPEKVLVHIGQNRLDKISNHLPDFLDMCLICMNAGLSYLMSLQRVSKELKEIHPEICYEFEYLLDQVKMGVPRVEALRQFAERNPTKDIQNLVQVLIQNEKLGSSVSEAIYEFSRRMYQQREEVMEEKAAKTSAKMAVVIMPFMLLPYVILMVGDRFAYFGS